MAGGMTDKEYSKDILMYDDNEDKWTKVGDLCHARENHAMSLAPAVVEDQCVFSIDCWIVTYKQKIIKF